VKSIDKNLREEFIVRDYGEKDFGQVADLWAETGLQDPERADTAETIDECSRLGGKLLILEQENTGIIVGTSWMTYDGRRIHLHHFCIKPAFQNMGLGKWLTHESLHFAKRKAKQIKLEVHKSNAAAIDLYQSMGFKYLGDYDVYIHRNPQEID
jgi:ribosomal protein S18 acetylase RimI-like enzyme